MSADNRTQLNDCEDDAQTFSTSGAQLGTATDPGTFYEGAASVDVQHSDNDDRTSTTGDSAGVVFDLDFTDSTVYLMIKDNLTDVFSAGGMQYVLGDGTDLIGYDVGGSDAVGLAVNPYYATIKLDVSVIIATPGNFATYAGAEGSLAHANITEVGYGSLHLSKSVGATPNLFIDQITHILNDSFALTINGGTVGTPETMADVVADDVTNGWGLVGNPVSLQYQFIAPTEWGDSVSLPGDAYFTATDEQWYWLGDNAGGHSVGATHFPFQVVSNATDTGSFVLERVVVVNTGARAQFDVSDVDVDFMQLTDCVFTDLGAITFPTQDVDKFANGCVFNNCDQVELSTMDMDDCTFNGSTDADGAVRWDEDDDPAGPTDQTNLVFASDATGNAIEVNPTGAGPFTYSIDGYTFDGYATQAGTDTNRVFFINPATLSADITINLTNSQAINTVGGGTDVFSHRDVGSYTGTLVIQQVVAVVVQVDDSAGDPVEGARVRVEEDPAGTLIVEGETNASGTFSTTTAHSTPQDVTTKVRLKGFKNFRTGGTLESTGLTVGVTFLTDNIVDLP